jgi:hypothetical protein
VCNALWKRKTTIISWKRKIRLDYIVLIFYLSTNYQNIKQYLNLKSKNITYLVENKKMYSIKKSLDKPIQAIVTGKIPNWISGTMYR